MKKAKTNPIKSNTVKKGTAAAVALPDAEPCIPDTKWQEISEQDERDLMILEIRDDIVNQCLDICFTKYMQLQSVAFSVHCSHLAWKKIINCFCLMHDPGESSIPRSLAWQQDQEPPLSPEDTWASSTMSVVAAQVPPVDGEKSSTLIFPVVEPSASFGLEAREKTTPWKAKMPSDRSSMQSKSESVVGRQTPSCSAFEVRSEHAPIVCHSNLYERKQETVETSLLTQASTFPDNESLEWRTPDIVLSRHLLQQRGYCSGVPDQLFTQSSSRAGSRSRVSFSVEPLEDVVGSTTSLHQSDVRNSSQTGDMTRNSGRS